MIVSPEGYGFKYAGALSVTERKELFYTRAQADLRSSVEDLAAFVDSVCFSVFGVTFFPPPLAGIEGKETDWIDCNLGVEQKSRWRFNPEEDCVAVQLFSEKFFNPARSAYEPTQPVGLIFYVFRKREVLISLGIVKKAGESSYPIAFQGRPRDCRFQIRYRGVERRLFLEIEKGINTYPDVIFQIKRDLSSFLGEKSLDSLFRMIRLEYREDRLFLEVKRGVSMGNIYLIRLNTFTNQLIFYSESNTKEIKEYKLSLDRENIQPIDCANLSPDVSEESGSEGEWDSL